MIHAQDRFGYNVRYRGCVTPAELGWDNVLKGYSDILSSDVRAHFLLIGRRAALRKERGRQDIIQAMKRQLEVLCAPDSE